MRGQPLLFPLGILLTFLLTACPAAGPGLSFTGNYAGTINPRDAARLPEAWRVAVTITVDLTQTGMSVSGTYTGTPPGSTATVTAIVTTPGEATGTIDPPGPILPVSANFFLTATHQDLVIQLPSEGNLAIVLERQP